MRIIAGEKKGRKLLSLEGENTRPTLDRVKESIFNIIQFDLQSSNVLDLFGGSGQMALEALSRGAVSAVICDNKKEAVDIIKKNVDACKYSEKTEIIFADYSSALKRLGGKKFDIVFLDPPYHNNLAVLAFKELISENLLERSSKIIIETALDEKIPETFSEFSLQKQYIYGKIKIEIFTVNEKK